MDSYLVRIYRREEGPKKEIAGTVKEVGKDSQTVFHSSHELVQLLRENTAERSGASKMSGDTK